MTADIIDRRRLFRALHKPGDPLVTPNPWDLGSARVLESLGAKALATTSSGHAFTLGRPDGQLISLDEALEHARAVVGAVAVPVSADLESGFGDAPEAVAATVRRAAAIGLAGCSIEDADHAGGGAYGFDAAMARAKAAVAAARESGIVLTLRADGFMNGDYDEAEAVRRAHAMADLGADVIYAPLVSPEALRAMAACGAPVNALAVGAAAELGREGLAALGVARISVGGALARLTHRVLIDAGRAVVAGDLGVLLGGAPGSEIDARLSR
ncbi:MAG: isocitrate lyase/phosphoenolpyruvate mutase family protein [Pikeienuella sp.]